MEFFCFHHDREGAGRLRHQLREEHWTYMDGYADQLIARGPTFADDGSVTGSVHIVRVEDAAAARRFALDEPYFQAGVYRDVLLRRWRAGLGRTMWDFPHPVEEATRYLVLGLAGHEVAREIDTDAVVACGSLLADDGGRRLGAAALVQLPDVAAARAVLTAGDGVDAEVHRWDFGGRPTDAVSLGAGRSAGQAISGWLDQAKSIH